jgi:glycosyltransferase involved in cell wall biosynthesis
MQKKFSTMYSVSNVITSYPDSAELSITDELHLSDNGKRTNQPFTFFYPSFARVFKNFEILCEAAQILFEQKGSDVEVIITVTGNENKYAKRLYRKYKHIPIIKWVGILSLEEVHRLYKKVDVLVFPSKLETWGLPISEFKVHNKPMLVADLPYAHETASGHRSTIFFDPDNATQLAKNMADIIEGVATYNITQVQTLDENIYYGW